MGLYKVLGHYWFSAGRGLKYSYWDNESYVDVGYLGNAIFLEDIYGRLLEVVIGQISGEEFNGKLSSSCIIYYSIYESSKVRYEKFKSESGYSSYLEKQVPINTNNAYVYIQEGCDIKNHLFSIVKYHSEDKYEYTGYFIIHKEEWEFIG